jgi:hypothetical protein
MFRLASWLLVALVLGGLALVAGLGPSSRRSSAR